MLRTDDGRTLRTRAELARKYKVAEQTLSLLWSKRQTNQHPGITETIDGTDYWDETEWRAWYRDYQRTIAVQATTNAPKIEGDPDEEVGPAEAARICGFSSTSTISHYLTEPPEGWPEPDSWDDLPSGRRRPKWKRRKLWAYLRTRKPRGHAGGRPAGRRGQSHPYQGDPRLDLARQFLAEHPDATNAELIAKLQQASDQAYSRPTWNLILNTARQHPKADS